MAITDAARRNREELFPERTLTFADTDPELTELFDNRAFDDVLAENGPDAKTRLMLRLAAPIACQ